MHCTNSLWNKNQTKVKAILLYSANIFKYLCKQEGQKGQKKNSVKIKMITWSTKQRGDLYLTCSNSGLIMTTCCWMPCAHCEPQKARVYIETIQHYHKTATLFDKFVIKTRIMKSVNK
jgi:hypothetical protein